MQLMMYGIDGSFQLPVALPFDNSLLGQKFQFCPENILMPGARKFQFYLENLFMTFGLVFPLLVGTHIVCDAVGDVWN